MSAVNFLNIKKIFGGNTLSDQEKEELFKETLIMSLARMTRADLTIDGVEVKSVIDYVAKATGTELSEPTIREAAASELFESEPLDKHLKKVAKHLETAHRVSITKGLAEVISSDGQVSDNEIDFFNTLVTALELTPAQLVFDGVS